MAEWLNASDLAGFSGLTPVRFPSCVHSGPPAGLGFVETNVRIQRNPVYKAFYRIIDCGNEPNVR